MTYSIGSGGSGAGKGFNVTEVMVHLQLYQDLLQDLYLLSRAVVVQAVQVEVYKDL